jgi:hypothetical protein
MYVDAQNRPSNAQSLAQAAGTSNLSSPTVLASGPTVLTAAGTIGADLLDVPLPDSAQRYLGVQYVIAGTMTTGKASAMFVAGTDRTTHANVTMNTGL